MIGWVHAHIAHPSRIKGKVWETYWYLARRFRDSTREPVTQSKLHLAKPRNRRGEWRKSYKKWIFYDIHFWIFDGYTIHTQRSLFTEFFSFKTKPNILRILKINVTYLKSNFHSFIIDPRKSVNIENSKIRFLSYFNSYNK